MERQFIQYLQHQRLLVDHFYVSAVAILIYDYALTLHHEIKYIWFSKWGYTKVLFLLTRYLTFILAFFILHNQLFLDVEAERCRITWPLVAWLIIFKNVFAETILCVRTWAVWNRGNVVGMMLVTTMVAYLGLQCFLDRQFIQSLRISPALYSGFRGCFLTAASRGLWEQFASLFVVETILLTLMVISAFRLYRTGRDTELSFIIHRDAIMFYVYLLWLSGSTLVMALVASLDLIALLVPLQVVLHTVFTTRIILNIRSAPDRGRGLDTELHTDHFEMWIQPMPRMQHRSIELGTYSSRR